MPTETSPSSSYPLLRPGRPDAPVALRKTAGGLEPVGAASFLAEAAALATYLPRRPFIVNLCRDRYRFAIGLAAALLRGQVSLLPPNEIPATLEALAGDYPDLYCLCDEGPPPLPGLLYPEELAPAAPPPEIPEIAAAQIAVVLFTSGSTGRPRPHAKSWGPLVRGALAAGERLGIAGLAGGTLLGTVPHQHSYGLESTVLLPLLHGLTLHPGRVFLPGDICAALAAAPRPRILVTTPVHLRSLLADGGSLPAVDLLLCATAPLPQRLAVAAEARFGAPLYEIYGCSEAGQIATRRTVETAEWRCLSGIALRQDGHGSWAAVSGLAEEVLLNDVLDLAGSDCFLLQGRTADLVNIAGKRTSIAHLNHHLNAIEGVEDGVFVMPEEGDGVTRLTAFVVAPGLTAAAVLAALRLRIDAAFLPRPLHCVTHLPRNALGKLTRADVARLAQDATGPASRASAD